MRIDLKSAAMLAATAFALLIVFGAVWPGHGVWLLALALVLCAAAAVLWLRETQAESASQGVPTAHFSPFADAVAYSRSANRPPSFSRSHALTPARGIPLAALVAAIGAVALVLYVGGATAGSGEAAQQAMTLGSDVEVIDRHSTDFGTGSTQTGTGDPGSNSEVSSETATAPLRPIVVEDPSGTTPLSQRGGQFATTAESTRTDDESAAGTLTPDPDTFTYIVESGDTLWDIATRFDLDVSVLIDLNGLSNADLQIGDELEIPEPAD